MSEALPELWLPSERDYTAEPPPARTAEAEVDEQAATAPTRWRYRTTVTVGSIDSYDPKGATP